jgi:hypothetical protein
MILSGNSSIGPVYSNTGSMDVEAVGCAGPFQNHRLIEIGLSGIEPPKWPEAALDREAEYR